MQIIVYHPIIIIIVGVFVKFFFGKFIKNKGEKLNSGSLVASGTDAISDSVLSLSTFIGAIISLIWNISLEGYLGLIISLFILKSAFEILKDTVNDLIGVRVDSNLTSEIRKTINNYEEVYGVYDLSLHNYGPNKIVGSAHIELSDNMKVRDVHRLTRRIELSIYEKFGIILTIGVYASNNTGRFKEIKKYLLNILKDYKNIIQMHGFYVDEDYMTVSFDLIFSFDEQEPELKCEEIKNNLKKKFSDYDFHIILDTDITD